MALNMFGVRGTGLTVDIDQPSVTLGQPAKINFTITSSTELRQSSLLLCQRTTSNNTDAVSSPTHIFNSLTVVPVLCANEDHQACDSSIISPLPAVLPSEFKNLTLGAPNTIELSLFQVPTANLNTPDSQWTDFFFCFTTDLVSSICNAHAFSPLFDISAPPNAAIIHKRTGDPLPTDVDLSATRLQTPILSINNIFISSGLSASPTLITTAMSTSYATTVTAMPTDSPTSAAAASGLSSSSNSVSHSSSGGLSLAEKIGIAIGALGAVFIILLLALLCLRRRHARRAAPEQVMLTHSIHTESRDLITEKEMGSSISSPYSHSTPPPRIDTPTRHSALSPYDSIPSQPYAGTAAAIPRRKPGTNTNTNTLATNTSSTVSRGLSVASSIIRSSTSARSPTNTSAHTHLNPSSPPHSPVSAHSHTRSLSHSTSHNRETRTSADFEEYHDLPIYGDARHVPQVFNGGLQAPFLSNSESEDDLHARHGGHGHSVVGGIGSGIGTSEEEAARLAEEEEERRIDAAIEEAERAKRGVR